MSSSDPKSLIQEINQLHARLDTLTYYELLEVAPDCPATKLQSQYRAKARKWHTDNYAKVELGLARPKLLEIFHRINTAYEVLSDVDKRAEYNVRLEREAQGLSVDVAQVFRAEALVDEAILNIKRRRYTEAKRQLEEAIALNPKDAIYHTHLGWATYNHDRNAASAQNNAILELKQAIALQENAPLAYQYLGQIYFDQKDYKNARIWWRRCQEWEPKNQVASHGFRLIASREEKERQGFKGLWRRLTQKDAKH